MTIAHRTPHLNPILENRSPSIARIGKIKKRQERKMTATMNRMAYWHSVLVAVAAAAVAIYYGFWGLIGLRLWAWHKIHQITNL
jgi:anti-sigma-K factor RskA